VFDKIATFEAKVAAKAQKAVETLVRKLAVAKNKEEKEALKTAYFASLPVEQRPSKYKPQAATARVGAGESMMTFGGVYYHGSTGTYDVATPGGLMHTTNAAQAAAWAQAAGGKATAASLVAGR
jgi:hypothetical protein